MAGKLPGTANRSTASRSPIEWWTLPRLFLQRNVLRGGVQAWVESGDHTILANLGHSASEGATAGNLPILLATFAQTQTANLRGPANARESASCKFFQAFLRVAAWLRFFIPTFVPVTGFLRFSSAACCTS